MKNGGKAVVFDIAGANRIFNVGGVQAIVAMAYGTKQVPKVDKIVGPGNKYVAEAKREIYGEVGIDFVAGPSEVLIVADESANAELIAADMLAQAEHDANAKANLISTSQRLVEEVKNEIEKQLAALATRKIAQEAIKNSQFIVVKDLGEAARITNEIAPEHLELQAKIKPKCLGKAKPGFASPANQRVCLSKFKNYGSLFLGEASAEVFGDYCLGPNHTLPTSGAARYTGGLSVRDFVKIVTVQDAQKTSKKLVKVASKLAEIEGFYAHKKAAEKRL
jgi:histidinol dehydrogenase